MSTLEERIRQRAAERQRSRPAEVIVGTRGSNPQTAARANRLGRDTGLPADVVERNLPDIESRIQARERVRTVQQAPEYTQKWFADPRNAAAGAPDAEQLARLGKTAAAMAFAAQRTVMGRYRQEAAKPRPVKTEKRNSTWLEGLGKIPGRLFEKGGNVIGTLATSGWNTLQEFEEFTLSPIDAAMSAVAGATGADWLDPERVRSGDRRQRAANLESWQGATARAQERYQGDSFITEGVLSGLDTVPLTIGALLSRNPYAAAGMVGGLVGAESYQTGRQGGMGAAEAARYAITQGVPEAAFEIAPSAKLLELSGKGAAKSVVDYLQSELPAEVATTLVQSFSEWVYDNPDRTYGEWAAGLPEELAQTALGVLGGGAVTVGAQQGVEYGGAGLRRGAAWVREARTRQTELGAAGQARAGGILLDDIMDQAANTQLRETDPEAFRQYVEGMAQNTPIENVYIPAEAIRELMQDGYRDDPFWSQHAAQIDEALALDGDVVLPLADVATHLAGTPEWATLREEARFSPGGISEAELKAMEERYASDGEQRQARLQEQADAATAEAEPAAQVYADIYNQLLAAGRNPNEARREATILAAQRETTAQALGMTALEYHQQNPVRIVRAGEAVTGGLTQVDPAEINDDVNDILEPEEFDLRWTRGGVPLDLIDIPNPDFFDEERAASLRGQPAPDRKPIIVRKRGDRYEMLDGAHRIRLAREEGRADIDALIGAEDPIFAHAQGPKATAARREVRREHYESLGPQLLALSGGVLARLRNGDQVYALTDSGELVTISQTGADTYVIESDAQVAKLNAAGLEERLERMLAKEVTKGSTNARELEQARDGSGRPAGGRLAPLEGAPQVEGASGPDPGLVSVAESYAEAQGIPLQRQAEYVEIDEEFSRRVADAYEAMEHAPDDPAVQAAYADLIAQTRAQYDALVAAGYSFTFGDPEDPYFANPWEAMRDLRANKTMRVFPTGGGFGTSDEFTPEQNPLLADTGLTWPDQNGVEQPVLANDLFRAVHDAFGHGLEGAGFRARGEENAWQAHARLFHGPALAALTSETRGQNSWLNFGPHGEANQTATPEDTVFADQKTGLLPEWAWTERRAADERSLDQAPVAALLEEGEVAAQGSDGNAVIGWRPERIETLLRQFGYGHDPERTKAYAVRMSPDEFLGLTASAKGRALIEQRVAGDEYGGEIDYGLMQANIGAPFLVIGKEGGRIGETTEVPISGRVMGHEGRHRMTLLKQAGVTSVPVILVLENQTMPTDFALGPQRSRSDPAGTGDTRIDVKNAQPISYANAANLASEFGQGRVLFQAEPFFSALERAVEAVQTKRAPAQQWLATLKKAPGVKAEELMVTGLEEWLAEQTAPVEKEQVLTMVREGGIELVETVKSSDMEGDELYERESELKEEAWESEFFSEIEEVIPEDDGYFDPEVPDLLDPGHVRAPNKPRYKASIDVPDFWRRGDVVADLFPDAEEGFGSGGFVIGEFDTVEEAQAAIDKASSDLFDAATENGWGDDYYSQAAEEVGPKYSTWITRPDEGENYTEVLLRLPPGVRGNPKQMAKNSHWDQQDVVAHFRYDTRTDDEGNTVLAIHEVQSDAHQAGRDRGYNTELKPEEKARLEAELEEAKAQRQALIDSPEYQAWQAEAARLSKAVDDATIKVREVSDEFTALTAWSARMLRSGHLTREEVRAKVLEDVPEENREQAAALFDRAQELIEAEGDVRQAYNRMDPSPHRVELDRLYDLEHSLGTKLDNTSGVPDMPFKGTGYVALVMKRIMQIAVAENFDRVVWIRGEMQNGATDAAGAWFYDEWNVGKDGKKRPGVLRSVTDDLLKKFTGGKVASAEEIAAAKEERASENRRLNTEIEATSNEISRLYREHRLNTGASGNIYVSTPEGEKPPPEGVVERVQELRQQAYALQGERYDLNKEPLPGHNRVTRFALPDLEPDGDGDFTYEERIDGLTEEDSNRLSELEDELGDEELSEGERAALEREREAILAEQAKWIERTGFLGFDVTPELKEAVGKGFALFQRRQGEGPRGSISGGIIAGVDGPTVISLMEGRDPSTVIHEFGHMFAEELRRNAALPNAPDWMRQDWATLAEWFEANGHPLNPDGSIPTEAHELLARGFERYTMEGKAPSSALKRVFQSFAAAMLNLYKHVANLRSPISPEVRKVFDRMLATEEAIEAAADRQQTDVRFANAEQAGMTTEAFAAYQRLADDARGEAFDALLYRTMMAIRRERTKAWKEEEARVRDEVTGQVNSRPEFRAIHFLRTGRFLDDPEREPVKMRLDEGWLKERFGDDIVSRLPKGTPITAENGDDPETIANLTGFASGEELVQALIALDEAKQAMKADGDNRPVKARAIADETAEIMAERHGDPLNDGSIEEEALAAIHNDRQGELIASEHRALARQLRDRPTPYSMAREWAKRKIAQGRVVDVASRAAIQRYARAQAKAAKAFEAALAEQNVEEAFRQSEIRLLNHALIAEAKKAADAVDVAVDRLSKVARQAKRKSVAQEYFDRAHALLEKFEFRTRSQRALDEMEAFAAWAAKQAEAGIDIAVPPRLEQNGEHYTRISVEELLALDDSVKQLLHLGRRKKSLLDAREKKEYEERRDAGLAVVEGIRQRKPNDHLNPTKFDRLKNNIASADAALLKMEQVFDWLDDGNSNGFFNTHVFKPIAEAQTRERERIGDMLGQVRDLMRAIPKKVVGKWEDAFSDPRLLNRKTGQPFKMVRQDLISMALNIGNEGNFAKLAGGYGWNRDTIMDVLTDNLTAEEWQFVQNVWDMVNTLWPEIEALEKRVNGVAPPKVEPRAFTLKDGTQMRGGYYPVVYDPTRSYRQEELQGKETDALFASGYQRATTRQGFAKERTDVERPIHLSLSVLNRHLTDVIHDLTHREIIMQADRILSDRKVVAAVDDALGPEVRKQFRPWLSHIANEWAKEGRELAAWEAFAKKLRTHSTIIGMGFRLTSILSQVAGYAGILERIGTRWWASGMRAYGNPIASFEFVTARSQEVRYRMDTLDRDINSNMREMQGRTGMLANARRFAFHGIGMMDRMVVTAGWMGAYNKGMSEGMSEEEAAYYADKVIRTSQGAGGAKDLAAIQRNSQFGMLATMFYSYASTFYNRQRALGRDTRDAWRARNARALPGLLARAFWLQVVGPILGQLPGAWLNGIGPDEDEEETWLGWGLGLMASNLFYGIPIVRDIAGSMASGFDYNFTPASRAVETVMKAGGDLISLTDDFIPEGVPGADPDGETEPGKRSVKTGVEAVGYVARLPVGQVSNAAQFIHDWASGEADPDGVGDWLEGLQRGKLEE